MHRKRIVGMMIFFLGIGLFFLVGFNKISHAWEVRIWDNDAPGWTTNFDQGVPIDTNATKDAYNPQLAIDSNGIVYFTYHQFDEGEYHIYLSRYNGTDVRIWNNTSGWITNFANGDPIDTNTNNNAYYPKLAIDSTNQVYVTYTQYDGSNFHIYLSRYDGTNVSIWNNDAPAGWTTTFTDGDPIDKGTTHDVGHVQLAMDSTNKVYITYYQNDGTNDHIYLSRAKATATLTVLPSGGGGGCFIATAAYGSCIEKHVMVLRDFRDHFLITNPVGKVFVKLYYVYSPPVANFIADHNTLRAFVRWGLIPLVGMSWMALHLGLFSTIALTLLLLVFVSASAIFLVRRMGLQESKL